MTGESGYADATGQRKSNVNAERVTLREWGNGGGMNYARMGQKELRHTGNCIHTSAKKSKEEFERVTRCRTVL